MSDIETAVQVSRLIENLLEVRLGATGRGLHEKISSVEDRLPERIVKRARFVASVRNGVVHDPVSFIRDPDGFRDAVSDVTSYLREQKPVASGRAPSHTKQGRARRPHRRNRPQFGLLWLLTVMLIIAVIATLQHFGGLEN